MITGEDSTVEGPEGPKPEGSYVTIDTLNADRPETRLTVTRDGDLGFNTVMVNYMFIQMVTG